MVSEAEVQTARRRMHIGIAVCVGSVLLLIATGASELAGAVGWLAALSVTSFVATFYLAWKYQQAFLKNAVANGLTEEQAQARWNEMYPNTD